MPIGPLIIRICHLRCDSGPTSLRLRITDYEKRKTQEGYRSCVKNRGEKQYKQEKGQSEGELEQEAHALGSEALLLVLACSCQRDYHVETLVEKDHQSMQAQMDKEKDKEEVHLVNYAQLKVRLIDCQDDEKYKGLKRGSVGGVE